MRKWGKLATQHKLVEDHNNKSGNDRKDWKYYDETSDCLDKDVTVTPSNTVESSAPSSQVNQDRDVDSDEDETPDEPKVVTSNGKKSQSQMSQMPKKPVIGSRYANISQRIL